MVREVIESFIGLGIHERMEIHDILRVEKDVSIIQKFFDNFGFENGIIGQALSNNPNTPTKILEVLSNRDIFITSILSNRNAPVELLNEYAKHKEFKYRMSVLKNINIPKPILETLCDDSLGMVMWEARKVRDSGQGKIIT